MAVVVMMVMASVICHRSMHTVMTSWLHCGTGGHGSDGDGDGTNLMRNSSPSARPTVTVAPGAPMAAMSAP